MERELAFRLELDPPFVLRERLIPPEGRDAFMNDWLAALTVGSINLRTKSGRVIRARPWVILHCDR